MVVFQKQENWVYTSPQALGCQSFLRKSSSVQVYIFFDGCQTRLYDYLWICAFVYFFVLCLICHILKSSSKYISAENTKYYKDF